MITITVQANTLQEAMEQLQLAPQAFLAASQPRVLDVDCADVSATVEAPEPVEASVQPEPTKAPKVTIEDVRSALMDLRKRVNGSKAKAVLQQFGVSGLSELSDDQYADVIRAAKEAA